MSFRPLADGKGRCDSASPSVENAVSAISLGQYFRSFIVKLNMMESLLGQLDLGGNIILLTIDILLLNPT
jgi:hypothetical protein